MLDEDHLGWLESIIFSKKNSKKKKFVLVNEGLCGTIKKINSLKHGALGQLHDALDKLPKSEGKDKEKKKVGGKVEVNSVVLYYSYHFSASRASNDYLKKLGSEIRSFINDN